MQAEVSHAAAEAWVGSGGFPSQLLLGDERELVWESVAVRHWGPAFVGVLLEERSGGSWFGGSRRVDANGNGHS